MKIDIKHIAKLANLTLSAEEETKFEKQLEAILEHMQKLQRVDTDNVETTSQVTGLENVYREDTVSQSLPAEKALSNTKSKHNNFFQVRGILEEQT